MRIVDLLTESFTAYHGSPHNFKKFASHRTNSTSIHGWGVYLTTNLRIATLYAKRGKSFSMGEVMFLLGFDQSGWIYHIEVDAEMSQLMNMETLDRNIVDLILTKWPEMANALDGADRFNNQYLYDAVATKLKSTYKASQWFVSQGILGGYHTGIYVIYSPAHLKITGREKIKYTHPIPPA